jgi:hypothetical protein
VAARPELVRIETDHRNPNERQPGTLSRWEYTEVDAPEVENEDAEPVTPCGASKRAIVVRGKGQALRAQFASTRNAPYIIRAVLSPSTRTPRPDRSNTKRSRPVAGVSKRTAPKHSSASSRMCPLTSPRRSTGAAPRLLYLRSLWAKRRSRYALCRTTEAAPESLTRAVSASNNRVQLARLRPRFKCR